MKTVFVLWSGGHDSTYLIQHLLSQPDTRVIAGYVEVVNNATKTAAEQAAISKLCAILRAWYRDRFEYTGTVFKAGVLTSYVRLNAPQLPVWFSALMVATPFNAQEVALGNIMHDCAISYMAEFQQMWDIYTAASAAGDPTVARPKLVFPLAKLAKETLLENLRPELRSLVVTCEYPKAKDDGTYTPCGECHTCNELARALRAAGLAPAAPAETPAEPVDVKKPGQPAKRRTLQKKQAK